MVKSNMLQMGPFLQLCCPQGGLPQGASSNCGVYFRDSLGQLVMMQHFFPTPKNLWVLEIAKAPQRILGVTVADTYGPLVKLER